MANKRYAVLDANHKYLKGIVLEEDRTLEDAGESIPENAHIVPVERFPTPFEHWDPTINGWVADEEKRAQLEAESRLDRCSRTELCTILMQEVQALVRSSLETAGIQLSAEQKAELFPLLGDES